MRGHGAVVLLFTLAAFCSRFVPLVHAIEEAECQDIPPGEFPCEMEKLWGKCDVDWMKNGGYCLKTCVGCPMGEEDGSTQAPTSDGNLVDGNLIDVGGTIVEVESPKTVEVGSKKEVFTGFRKKCKTLVELLEKIPDASIASRLVSSLETANEELFEQLDDKDTQFTFFVPLDTALEAFLDLLEAPEDPKVVELILKAHILNEVVHTRTMDRNAEFETLAGTFIEVDSVRKSVALSSGAATAEVVLSDALACHTIVHLVDGVLLDPEA